MQSVSVIISSFNRLKYFEKSYPSLLRQLQPEDEIVVVEDGTDDWIPFLNGIKHKWTYYKTNNNNYRSCSIPKNIAVKLSNNPLVFIQEAEVIHLSDCLTSLRQRVEEEDLFYVPGDAYFGRHPGDEEKVSTIKNSQAPFLACVRKSSLENVGGWDERFVYWGNDDNDLMHRLGLNNCHHKVDATLSFFHQWHPRPPQEAMGDYNESLLYEPNKKIVANEGKEWGVYDQNKVRKG